MRWMPLILILTFTIISGINIYRKETRLAQRGFDLIGLTYITLLEIIVFTPISFFGSAIYVMPLGIGQVNLTQLDIFNLGFVENIILTVPLGMMIKWSFSRFNLAKMATIGVLIGGSIETIQYYLSHAFLINRSSDINDVLANAMGIVVGSILVSIAIYTLSRIGQKAANKTYLRG